MNMLTKYTKWLFAACLLAASPVFTSCNDDDEVVVQIPENFTMDLSSLNIAWNETEGVVELEANNEWRAESESPWISIDPSRGEPGDFRMFLNFEANPYRLPRVGHLTVTCGEQTGTITVTQAGCTDDSKVPVCAANLEVESLDYATGEIPFSTFAGAIEGNLGLSLAQFSEGIGEDGNLEFFMVDKDGKWVAGGTAGTPCGAWLDADLNVTNWNGAGYPTNTMFVECYGGEEDPVLVIGRAPGVPDDAEFTLNFGFTFKDDHSKYCIFKIDVVFPKMDLKGELVGTLDLNITSGPVEYNAFPVAFDADAVCSLLGCSSVALAKVVSYDADGEFIPYSANNGYWFAKDGSVGSWGDDAGWFMEYYGSDEEATEEDITSWYFGTMPGATNISGVSKIGFWYNAKVVMFNVTVTVTE